MLLNFGECEAFAWEALVLGDIFSYFLFFRMDIVYFLFFNPSWLPKVQTFAIA